MAYDPTGDWPTIAQVTKETTAGNKFMQKCIEMFNQTNDLAEDLPFTVCNEGQVHTHLMDADVPDGTWRRANEGIRAVSASSIQVSDTVALLENRSEADVVVAARSGDVAAYRARQDRRIIGGLNNNLAWCMFYGDPRVDPRKFFGLSPRYDVLGTSPTNAASANNFGMRHILSAGGTTSSAQTSIWLLGLGVDTGVFGIYPSTAPNAGISAEDLGKIDLHDADGKVFRGYATHFTVQQGLAIADWRNVVRIANVEFSAAMDEASINLLCDIMIEATNALPDLKMVRPVFYCNRQAHTRLLQMANRKSNVALGFSDLYGIKNQLNISGFPIKRCDAIVSTEAVVS